MDQAAIRELRTQAAGLIREVAETGKPLLITRRGKPVARLVPFKDEERLWADARKALDDFLAFAHRVGRDLPPGLSAVELVREQRRDL